MVNVLRREQRHKKQMSREQMEGLRRYITTTTINFSAFLYRIELNRTNQNRDQNREQVD